jgi:HEAT repeats
LAGHIASSWLAIFSVVARKSLDAWLFDLREGLPKKKAAAARKLAELDPVRAREVLVALLALEPATEARRMLGRCLHWVADAATARLLAADPQVVLEPQLLPTSACIALYDDLRVELPALSVRAAQTRLTKLAILGTDLGRAHGRIDDEALWKDALLRCLVAVLDDTRLAKVHVNAAATLRRLDTRAADRALLDRFETRPSAVSGVDAYVAWMRLGLPGGALPAPAPLVAALTSALGDGGEVDARLDALLATTADQVPEALVLPLARALTTRALPALAEAIAQRIVARTRGMSELLAVVDDDELRTCWPRAYAALLEKRPDEEGRGDGVRAVIERAARATPVALRTALAKLPAAAVFDLVAPQLAETPSLWSAMVDVPSTLHDPRWLPLAAHAWDGRTEVALVAMARDPDNPSRSVALARLVADVEKAGDDVVGRRAALTTLGKTGHPDATPTLLAAFEDPKIGSAMALTLTAIGQCAGREAVPFLESRCEGFWRPYIEEAIAAIRARAAMLSRELVVASCADPDPVIADLAKQARDGDLDALAVLEDALRERGALL